MSAYEMGRVWGESTATGSALLTHLALADCAVNGIASARHEALAAATRLSVASVARAIDHLVAIDEILIVKHKAGSRVAQIAVLPWSGDRVAIYKVEGFPYTSSDSSLQRHIGELADKTDSGPTEIVDPLLDAITGEPDEPQGYAYSAPPAIQPVAPPRAPLAMLIAPGDVARVLNAAGVPKNDEMPAYWWRTEHKADLADLCERLGVSVDVIVERLMRGGQTVPDLRRISDLEPLVRG